LSRPEQHLHLAASLLSALACAFLMAPAAFHAARTRGMCLPACWLIASTFARAAVALLQPLGVLKETTGQKTTRV
jgi:hypothetical protein